MSAYPAPTTNLNRPYLWDYADSGVVHCRYRDEERQFAQHVLAAHFHPDYPLDQAVIAVGPEQREFKILKELITTLSPVIREAFKPRSYPTQFIESATLVYRLPEEKVDTFQCLLMWMMNSELRDESQTPPVETLVDVFNLADKLMMVHCQNYIVNVMAWYEDRTHELERAVIAGAVTDEHLPEGSNLRRYIVDKLGFDIVYRARSFTDTGILDSPEYAQFVASGTNLAYDVLDRAHTLYERSAHDGFLPVTTDPRLRRCAYHDHFLTT